MCGLSESKITLRTFLTPIKAVNITKNAKLIFHDRMTNLFFHKVSGFSPYWDYKPDEKHIGEQFVDKMPDNTEK